jgi:ABC-2 type transport system ATP-binding protein
LRAQRTEPRLRVEVEGASNDWLAAVPGAEIAVRDDRGVLVELREGVDDQAVLDAARRAGRVRTFAPARPTLAELFREVVEP